MKKIIAEFRIDSHILFYKFKEEIAESLLKDFPDWQTNSIGFNLINNKKKRYCVLEHNRIAVVDENNHNEHDFFELVMKIISNYDKKIKINSVERAGVRFQIGTKTKFEFKELVEIFQEKFYPNTEEFSKIFVKNFKDVAFSGVYEKDGCKFQLGTGPTQKLETMNRIDFKFQPDLKEFSDTMLFIDFDGYREKFDSKDLSETVKIIQKELHETTKQVLKVFKIDL